MSDACPVENVGMHFGKIAANDGPPQLMVPLLNIELGFKGTWFALLQYAQP